ALPGVLAAGAINELPASANASGASRTIFQEADTSFENLVMARPVAMVRSVTSGYFAASGTALRAGRFFNEQEPALVALISESLAKSLWPNENPAATVGRALRQGDVSGPLIVIAGVVENVRPGTGDREGPPVIYRPYEQFAGGRATIVVKTAQEPSIVAPAVRAAIRR